jgi:hypothetical protein
VGVGCGCGGARSGAAAGVEQVGALPVVGVAAAVHVEGFAHTAALFSTTEADRRRGPRALETQANRATAGPLEGRRMLGKKYVGGTSELGRDRPGLLLHSISTQQFCTQPLSCVHAQAHEV